MAAEEEEDVEDKKEQEEVEDKEEEEEQWRALFTCPCLGVRGSEAERRRASRGGGGGGGGGAGGLRLGVAAHVAIESNV